MTHMIPRPATGLLASPALVLDAARCWRGAKDRGNPIQPSLFAALRTHGYALLAPVFDSLMTLCEAALGRALRVGAHDRVSDDEALLLDLLDGTRYARACFACGDGLVTTLDCALCSTRIMLSLARATAGEDGPALPSPHPTAA